MYDLIIFCKPFVNCCEKVFSRAYDNSNKLINKYRERHEILHFKPSLVDSLKMIWICHFFESAILKCLGLLLPLSLLGLGLVRQVSQS